MSAGVEPMQLPAEAVAPRDAGPRGATPAFAAATFLGAFLLFFVQPMVAKYILPWFGGGAAVWTTCLLFFQAVLLLGYTYAHLGVSRLAPKSQSLVHLALLLAAVVLAVVGAVPSDQWKPASGEAFPVVRILSLLAVSVGLPCVVLSATSPLLHAWYARVRPDAQPGVYRLYALSNVGSLLALVSYPFFFEPLLSRRGQATLWTAGLALYAVACAYCAWVTSTAAEAAPTLGDAERSEVGAASAAGSPSRGTIAPQPTARQQSLWVLLPACATVLLMATTNTMTQDLAPVPLLWVLPLALYLLTFILAFADRRVYRRRLFGWLLALASIAVCVVLFLDHDALGMKARIGLLAAAMFACCMALHGELAALRPPTRHLTGYYLAIAAGGAVGGLLVAVAAPLLLDRYAELPIGLWLCCALVFVAPWLAGARMRRGDNDSVTGPRLDHLELLLAVAGLVVLTAPVWAIASKSARDGVAVVRTRDFYGALTVYRSKPPDAGGPSDESIWLTHGSIVHGQMFLAPAKRALPTKYYTPTSGIHRLFHDPAWAGRPRRVGVVGLGAGTLAAYGRPGDTFRFYEISPAVARLADDPFRFLADSPARCSVVLGDGRVSLEREPPQAFDVIVLDAFSGDAVPVHLLTAEAFDVYRRHLAPGGVVVVNCTNRYVHLAPVLARLADRLGWSGAHLSDETEGGPPAAAPSDWAALSPDPARLAPLRRAGGRDLPRDDRLDLWTDERTNLFKVLR